MSAGAFPFPAPGAAVMAWGAQDIAATTTARFLFPSYVDLGAPTTLRPTTVPRAGTFRNARVTCRDAGVGAATITYTLVVNGGDTALVVSMANTAVSGTDSVNQVTVAAGDILTIRANKSAGVTSSQGIILFVVEFV